MVDAILHAGAQVFREAGFERASTNLIAQVAGVSVGSLYQYFPNKEAIAAALVGRIQSELLGRLREIAEAAAARAVDADAVRAVVGALVDAVIDVHAREPQLVRLFLTTPEHVHDASIVDATHIVAGLLERYRGLIVIDDDLADLDDIAWVLVRAVDALLMGHEVAPRLSRPALRAACVRLALTYLGVPHEASRATKNQ
jgi:AcrR family transcriptional regulator